LGGRFDEDIMAATKQLAVAVRSGTGKGAARSVRREGRVPGVIYGGGEAAEPISLDYREIHRLIYAGHFLTTIFELDIEGRRERVIPRDYQLDPVKDMPLHVDFFRLNPGSRLRLEIPVHFINAENSPGIKRGGALNIVLHAIELLVPGDRIPDAIEVDVGDLDINDSLHISGVKLPEGCQPTVRGRDFTVATIAPPTTLSEAEVSAEASAAADAAAKSAAAAPPKGGVPLKGAAPAKGAAAPAKGAAPAKPAGKK
jgi:large subunit ribosomal protein L25